MILNIELNEEELACILCGLDALIEADEQEASYYRYCLNERNPELAEDLDKRIKFSLVLHDRLRSRIQSLKGV